MRQPDEQGAPTSNHRSLLHKPKANVGTGFAALGGTINSDGEAAGWRMEDQTRPYLARDDFYDDYDRAHDYAVDCIGKNIGLSFDQLEPEPSGGWNAPRGHAKRTWDQGELTTRNAWDRLKGSTSHAA